MLFSLFEFVLTVSKVIAVSLAYNTILLTIKHCKLL